jgi:2-methylcitrate dehydratase PrpD
MYCSETIADYIQKCSFADLPDSVIRQVKLGIRDSIGCSLSGSTTQIGKIIIDTITALCGGGTSTIIGSHLKTSPPYAAFVNGSTADILELNDTFKGHPGATVVAPAISVGETIASSGQDLIVACYLGYEMCIRTGSAVSPTPEIQLMAHGLGTYQTFGAVAATGKLLSLNKNQLINALGIAGTNAPLPCNMKTVEGPLGNSSMVKNNFGTAAHTGVLSALMAQKGFTGPPDVFEGDNGFWRMYGSDRCDLNKLTGGLGSQYQILNMGFKAYSSCGATHGAIDGVRTIMNNNSIDIADIETVVVRVPAVIAKMPWSSREIPATIYAAEFSIPYTVALVITGLAGKPGPEWYEPVIFSNPAVVSVLQRVYVEPDAEADRLRSDGILLTKVEIVAQDRKYSERVEYPKGNVKNPMSDKELEDKFKYLAGLVLPGSKVNKLNRILENLETLGSVSELTELLS